jgi:hypothetical protein
MKKNTLSAWYFFSSLFYSIGQLSLGLLLHPYRTMQMLVEDKVFVWMALIPTLLLGFSTIVWRFLLMPFLNIVLLDYSDQTIKVFMLLLTNWFTFYMFFWQILLLYLLFRFSTVLRPD